MFGFLTLAWLFCLGAGIVSAVRRKGSKKYWIAFGVIFVMMIISAPKSSDDSNNVQDSGPYKHKASSSVSHASDIVGNFPTGQDREDYAQGLEHIGHLHRKIVSYTIYEVITEGRAIREHHNAAQNAEAQRVASAASAAQAAKESATAKAKAAEDANYFHGSPDCLMLDRRSLTTERDDYTVYVKGTVKNTCDQDFSYVQVEVNFRNASGSVEDSGLANVNNLASGETWSWKTIQEGSAGGTWRVEAVTGR